ncbi:Psy4p NDAI_0J00560 [Naumovozyma dairenensis CBS 421]|uniref:Serine/threonine-protein phosphatase 4 regulatory subunit 2 n=1 Tax=Naumovozyma dairenensis (strain ATCC 10597 / BCRC 20456 / CBS 421 / NBRC 0211 / NRRL Y-12639) TaxID=1071378 RepID=G0WGM0_NAUDC|nr:hypothetical protein NDAI_0J00560 [Naumovozyma dairenensis CBS 421]CCD26948.1 hypothetical protein NDAI_0J00560 [Naumovozyma dairenensis CBS 421]
MENDSELNSSIHNMMGIKSRRLYEYLNDILITKKVKLSNSSNEPIPFDLLINDFIPHMIDVTPNESFINSNEENIESIRRLKEMGENLIDKFFNNEKLPFTIMRIFELCFDPFKYFKVNELVKYVNALEKCCYVDSCLTLASSSSSSTNTEERRDEEESNGNTIGEDGDASLVKIPWITEKDMGQLLPIVKEIDVIMNVEFDDDDEDDDEEDDEEHHDVNGQGTIRERKSNKHGGTSTDDISITLQNDKDFIIEEYYEDDDDDDDDMNVEDTNKNLTNTPDDEEEQDDDYVDDNMGDTSGDDDDDDADENDENDEIGEDDEEDEDIQMQDVNENLESKTPRKRKPTEIDNYEYNENLSSSPTTPSQELLTPKKMKQDVTPTTIYNDNHSSMESMNRDELVIKSPPGLFRLDQLQHSNGEEELNNSTIKVGVVTIGPETNDKDSNTGILVSPSDLNIIGNNTNNNIQEFNTDPTGERNDANSKIRPTTIDDDEEEEEDEDEFNNFKDNDSSPLGNKTR